MQVYINDGDKDALEMLEDIIYDILDNNLYKPNSAGLYSAAMSRLDDSEWLGTTFSNHFPRRDAFPDFPSSDLYDAACIHFWKSEEGKHLQGVAVNAHAMADAKITESSGTKKNDD